jgi:molybdopterin converting factor small subunit
MKIYVQLFGKLGANLGSEIELDILNENPTIRDVVNMLIQKDPNLKSLILNHDRLHQATILLVNGHVLNQTINGLDMILDSKDRIRVDRIGFLEIVGGG